MNEETCSFHYLTWQALLDHLHFLQSPNSVLLSLRTNSVNRDRFRNDRHRDMFLQSIENAVGLDDVEAQLHGIFNDSQGVQ